MPSMPMMEDSSSATVVLGVRMMEEYVGCRGSAMVTLMAMDKGKTTGVVCMSVLVAEPEISW